MAGENFNLGITFKGDARNFIGATAKAEAAVGGFARTAIGAAARVNSAFLSLGNSWLAQITAITVGIAGMAALKGIIDAEYRMTRFGINAGITGEKLAELRREISAAALATSNSTGEITTGLEEMLRHTGGNLTMAREQMKLLGIVASATGASTGQVGLVAADMLTKMNIPAKDLLNTFDGLHAQGKMGGFYLSDFAANSSELMQAAIDFGVKGEAQLLHFNALLQLSAKGKSNPAEIANSFAMALGMIKEKSENGKIGNINLYDKKKSVASRRRVFRDVDKIIEDLIVAAKGDETVLQKFFGPRAVKAISPIAESYRKYGDFRELEKLNKVTSDGTEILRDFNTVQGTTKDQLKDLGHLASEIAKENMAGPFTTLKYALDMLQEHPVVAKGGIYALLGLGGAVGASVIANKIKDVFGGKTAGGIGGELAKNLGIQKVFVTNWPNGMMGSGDFSSYKPGDVPGADATPPPWWNKSWNLPGKMGTAAKMGAGISFGLPIIAGMIAAGTLYDVDKTTQTNIESTKNTASAHEAFALAAINKQQGTHYGTQAEAMARLQHGNRQRRSADDYRDAVTHPAVRNDISISVHVDKDGNSRAITTGKNTITRVHNPGAF